MVECRHCRASFEVEPEQIGARCPDCKLPLFERSDRPKREVESGVCAFQGVVPGVCNCSRCHRRLCSNCRTRWHDENLCLRCVEDSSAAHETHPREIRTLRMQSIRGFVLALIGAFIFTLGLWILYASRNDPSSGASAWSVVLMLVGVIPGVVALGQGAAVVLKRGPLLNLATSTVALASSQIGLTIGLAFINLWRN
jgi:hypothetical protein